LVTAIAPPVLFPWIEFVGSIDLSTDVTEYDSTVVGEKNKEVSEI